MLPETPIPLRHRHQLTAFNNVDRMRQRLGICVHGGLQNAHVQPPTLTHSAFDPQYSRGSFKSKGAQRQSIGSRVGRCRGSIPESVTGAR